MRTTTLRILASCCLLFSLAVAPVLAGDDGQDEQQLRRERSFQQMLTGAELAGFFSVNGADMGEPLEEDRYTISKVTRLKGDIWRFDCRVQYGERDVTVPIPLAVKWAGDTPVITLTEMNIPMLGTYSARVLFYGDQYAGTWSAGDHGGQMFGRVIRAATASTTPATAATATTATASGVNWPSFRGHAAAGVADGASTPVRWNLESGQNVKWKSPIPGLGHSSAVIWGDRLFVTTAVGEGDAELKVGLYGSIQPVDENSVHRFMVSCLDKNDGRVLWTRTAHEGVPKVKRHPKASHASSSPVTDGTHVVAFFGSEGLYCYDMDGTLKWSKDFGLLDSGYFMVQTAQWGFASSPIIHEDMVIVQCDVQGDSFVAALDIADGTELWRTPRDEVPTWSTPTVYVGDDGRGQVIVNGWHHIGGYDLKTGDERWRLRGGGDIPVPTPVLAPDLDLVFITNAHGRMAPIYAIKTAARGDLGDGSETMFMAWSKSRRGNYMQTPLVYGEHLYCCNDAGILACYQAMTGEEVYRERLGAGSSGFSASAVAAGGKIYLTSEEGEIHVIKAGPSFESLAVNDMGETCMATPAISEGVLFFRTRGHVVAVGE